MSWGYSYCDVLTRCTSARTLFSCRPRATGTPHPPPGGKFFTLLSWKSSSWAIKFHLLWFYKVSPSQSYCPWKVIECKNHYIFQILEIDFIIYIFSTKANFIAISSLIKAQLQCEFINLDESYKERRHKMLFFSKDIIIVWPAFIRSISNLVMVILVTFYHRHVL